MNKRERTIIRKHLESIYREWHVCGLDAASAKEMGLEPGRLCDNCKDMIAAHMKQINYEMDE